jgi:glycosyltransferase involved in cell wall biosynthesis
MNKKVLHIFGKMDRGGAELRTLATLTPLQEKGINIEFCSLSGEEGLLDEEIRSLGSNVHLCKLGILFPIKFYQLLRSNKFDVVHSHVAMVSGYILFIAWLAGVSKRIAHFRNTHDAAKTSIIRKWRNKFLHTLINIFASNILGVCNAALSIFWRKDWQKDSRCKTIYNGLQHKKLCPKEGVFWDEHKLDNNYPVILNVARLVEQKNHLFMIEVLAAYIKKNGPAYLALLGKEDKEIKQSIIALANEKKCLEYVLFLGVQSNVYEYLYNADIMIFPSLWEGLPGSVIEAASVGVPVVANDVPGVIEIAAQLPCVHFLSVNDPIEDWVNALEKFSSNNFDVREKHHNTFKQSQFNLNQCVDALYAIYQ